MPPRAIKVILGVLCSLYGLFLVLIAGVSASTPSGGLHSPFVGRVLAIALVYLLCGIAMAGIGVFLIARGRQSLPNQTMISLAIGIIAVSFISVGEMQYASAHKITAAQKVAEELKLLD